MDNNTNNSSSKFQQDFFKSVKDSATSSEAQVSKQRQPKNTKQLPKWIFIVLPIVVLAVVGGFIAVAIIGGYNNGTDKTSSLFCTNDDEVQIKITYSDSELLDYSASNIPFDFEDQKTLADLHGVEYTIMNFAYWFEDHVQGGHCDL